MTGQRGITRPVEPGVHAFDIVGNMEIDILTIRDLGTAIVMAAESTGTSLDPHHASAFARLGLMIVERTDALGAKRDDAWTTLRRYAYPGEVQP